MFMALDTFATFFQTHFITTVGILLANLKLWRKCREHVEGIDQSRSDSSPSFRHKMLKFGSSWHFGISGISGTKL